MRGLERFSNGNQREISFVSNGVIALDVPLGDDGKPIMVKDPEGNAISLTIRQSIFSASNGEKAVSRYANLISPRFAAEYLRNALKGAEIIERGPNLDKDGQKIGERFVALINDRRVARSAGPQKRKMVAAVIRTSGTRYWERTASNSMETAIAFDKYLEGELAAAQKP